MSGSHDEAQDVQPQKPGAPGLWMEKITGRRSLWVAVIALVVILALLISLFAIPRKADFLAETPETLITSESETSMIELPPVDSDGDGLFDHQEIEGWEVEDGNIYKTDPLLADSDGDGLTDMEEAGELLSDADNPIYAGISNPLKADSDDDGLDDKTEVRGWRDSTGKKYKTDPLRADTDGDGLNDGVEAGRDRQDQQGGVVYALVSDPTKVDSDRDGLSDAEELNFNTDPFVKDSDGDELNDGIEVSLVGTDPTMANSDGDEFDDGFEIQQKDFKDIDPLEFNVIVSTTDYATDYAIGLVFGDLNKKDTIAWLLGVLTRSGISMANRPIGAIVRTLANVRDLIAALIDQDWVEVAFVVRQLLFPQRESQVIRREIEQFAERKETLKYDISNMINGLVGIPEHYKLILREIVWGEIWRELEKSSFSESELDQLARHGNDLRIIDEVLDRSVILNMPAKPFRSNNAAEMFVGNEFKLQGHVVDSKIVMRTDTCDNGSNPLVRVHDLHVADNKGDVMAVEVNVGRTLLTDAIKMQIQSDLCLRRAGQIDEIRWEFLPTHGTGKVGPSAELAEHLKANDIEISFRSIR